jgi:RNA polymerase sigma-70 factor
MKMRADKLRAENTAREAEIAGMLSVCALLEGWWRQAGAERWGISREQFASELARCAVARFREVAEAGGLSSEEVQSYVGSLALEDVALACACADGVEAAWEYFVGRYRGYLRACAGKMMRKSLSSPEVEELADSLFAELYGVSEGKRAALLRYFHGRSTLRTWLRAVLTQRHVDRIRAGRRFEELEEEDTAGDDGRLRVETGARVEVADPHRERYVMLFVQALKQAMGMIAREDARLLEMYYAEEKKLAEIGRVLGEHESSVSRHLEKARRELRERVEGILRGGVDGAPGTSGMSGAEMELCFEYSAEDAPVDLEKLFLRRDVLGEEPNGEAGDRRRNVKPKTHP